MVVALCVAGVMLALERSSPRFTIAMPGLLTLTMVLALVGIGVVALGVASFRRARTTVNPLQPHQASALVTSGIYRVTRNPMYVGMLLLLLSWTVYLAHPFTVAGPILFVIWMNRYQIPPEESALAALFGEAYQKYCRQVRRWL